VFVNDIVNWKGRIMYFMELSEIWEGPLNPRLQPINYSITPQKSIPVSFEHQNVESCAIQIAK
jgi:hypothetical protein